MAARQAGRPLPVGAFVSRAVLLLLAIAGAALAQGETDSTWQAFLDNAQKAYVAGHWEEAEDDYQQALKIADRQNQIIPGVVNCLSGLALVYHQKGDFAESERLYELAMRNLEGVYGPTSTQFADWMPALAWLYDEHGKADKAEVLWKRALKIREQTYGKDDQRVAEALDSYARFLAKHSRLSEAATMEARAKSIRDKLAP